MTQLPIPVHVGSEPPDDWDDIEARQRQYTEDAGPYLRDKRRPAVAKADLDWGALGFEPRWVGFDTADCAAALQPSVYSGRGADEFDRFRQGAERRGETALVISPVGEVDDASRNVHSVFGPPVDSVSVGRTYTSIDGRVIGRGARVRAAADLGDADGQLALRLLSCNPAPTWRSLSLRGAVMHSVFGPEEHAAEGELLAILETELGEPVVAAWISLDGVERRYLVPVETPWTLLLSWLLEQALPEFVPGAMRRARRPLASDEELMTRRERDVRAALAALQADYSARREELERKLEEAQGAAVAIREGLLYGTGQQLVAAVRSVFESAGVIVVDLDVELGGTKNADLLCTSGGRSRLVEVKSASGSASERAYQDLLRHLREWPNLPGATPIDGGALVVSHDLRTAPLERSLEPYARPEFLAAQTEPVISALELFVAWRDEDQDGIRQMLSGPVRAPVAPSPAEAGSPVVDAEPVTSGAGRRRWFGRRRVGS
ncbi:hypothetical protein [Cellulomonas sp. KRMCY2]|uniref:hypothetical protein n=1 Tax=Cellulomonas sp. KRMCY2 TaxID=1304865 RepID=UPI00045E9F65|nr:hypothetical protein [Cellulomonas sp. KRMCY2]